MNRFVQLLFSLLLLLSGAAWAEDVDKANLVRKFAQASGLNAVIEGLPAQIVVANQQRLLFAPDAQADEVGQLLTNAMNVERAKQQAFEVLMKSATESDLRDVVEWLDSPFGQQVTAAGMVMTKPGWNAELLRYLADLETTPPTAARATLILQLEKSAKMTETGVESFAVLLQGLNKISEQVGKRNKKSSPKKMKQQMQEIKTLLRSSLHEQMVLISHFVYRDFSDEQVQQYINFLNGDIGGKYVAMSMSASIVVLNDFFSDMLADIKAGKCKVK